MKKLALILIIILLCTSLAAAATKVPKPKYAEGMCDCGSLELQSEQFFDGHGLTCRYYIEGGLGHRETGGLGQSARLSVSGYEWDNGAQIRFESDKKTVEPFPDVFCTGCTVVKDERSETKLHLSGHKPGYQEGTTFYYINIKEVYKPNAAVGVSIETMHKGDGDKVAEMEAIAQQLLACGKSAIDNAGEFPFEKPGMKSLTLTSIGDPLRFITAKIVTADEEYTAYSDENGVLQVPESGEVTIVFTYHSDKDYFTLYVGNHDKPAELILTLNEGKVATATFHAYKKQHDISIEETDIEEFKLDVFYDKDPELLSTFQRYVYMADALEFYKDFLGVTFEKPVISISWVNAACGACYEDYRILIDGKKSSYRYAYAPYIDFHEFSHYAMEEMYGSALFKEMIKEKNHGGFVNPTTGDSWMEGFAALMATAIATGTGRSETLSDYPLIGSLDNNYKPWDMLGMYEEAAIASVLYDLLDDEEDSKEDTKMYLSNLADKFFGWNDWNNDGSLTKKEVARGEMWRNSIWEGRTDTDSLRDIFANINFSYEEDSWSKSEFEQEFEKMITAGIDLDIYIAFALGGKIELGFPFTKEQYVQKGLEDSKDDDAFSMDFEDLWEIMKEPHKDFTSVYEAISKKQDVDALFIQHHFYMDTGEGDRNRTNGEAYIDSNNDGWYTKGEPYIDYPTKGFSYDIGEKVGTPSNYERTARRSSPEIPGMYIEVDDAAEQYKVVYANPLTGRYYEIVVQNEDGKIYIPPPGEDMTIEITGNEVETKNPLTLSSRQIVAHMDEIVEQGTITSHDFEIIGEQKEKKDRKLWPWLLLIVIGGGMYLGATKQDHIKKHTKKAVATTKKGYAKAKPKVQAAAKKTKEATKKTWEKAKPKVQAAAKKTKESVKKGYDKAKPALKKAWETTSTHAKKGYVIAKKKVKKSNAKRQSKSKKRPASKGK